MHCYDSHPDGGQFTQPLCANPSAGIDSRSSGWLCRACSHWHPWPGEESAETTRLIGASLGHLARAARPLMTYTVVVTFTAQATSREQAEQLIHHWIDDGGAACLDLPLTCEGSLTEVREGSPYAGPSRSMANARLIAAEMLALLRRISRASGEVSLYGYTKRQKAINKQIGDDARALLARVEGE